ncbi:MAG: hypothetical protein KDA77_18595 [Planctomycetaceae bacterium]|nr:hypothetical protein [Planctomycetaceae bacterium]
MNQGESDRPTREQRQQSYNDERELTEYIFWNYRKFMTTLEQLTEKKMQLDESRRHDSLEGVVPFRNKVRDRILSEHGDQILINRCAKCNRIVATPRAQQCLWCGYDWHHQTPPDQS